MFHVNVPFNASVKLPLHVCVNIPCDVPLKIPLNVPFYVPSNLAFKFRLMFPANVSCLGFFLMSMFNAPLNATFNVPY